MSYATLIFTLGMPSNSAWNGKWSGEGQCYEVSRRVTQRKADEIAGGNFTYNFGDGWVASVSVRKSSGAIETRKSKKRSRGFCGYDWMVDSILTHGGIFASRDDAPKEAEA